MLSRRQLLKGLLAFTGGTVGLAGYAVAEPWRLGVTRYKLTPPGWTPGLDLKIAVIADIHACNPWMSVERIRQIVARTNALAPDITLLLGDYVSGHRMNMFSGLVPHDEWAQALTGLKAPLGVHSVLGNHDWWESRAVQRRDTRVIPARVALEKAGLPVYENDVLRLEKDGKAFWLAGLGDQWAYIRTQLSVDHRAFDGVENLPGTLAKVTDEAPVVLMAHEPDIFPEVPKRVALTISGHTHGGQVQFMGFAPLVPSRFGRRYMYGHIVEEERHLIVSGGLGCSGLPVRFGRPPEIVMIELGSSAAIS